ncbi:unnamed protein product [Bursaphelenchus okinawaensis]|uniref:Uncharacterized protein n=1 Tax=Bursaphelenchus okinawaensis TaxID=465554 RepID=A0A811K3P4_9BILA|nr:unnamed protein product [Bursaphelenchus okinawaensis]CAG9091088.1 unnamed protein product [Bursaphelenchus okinawaensis]
MDKPKSMDKPKASTSSVRFAPFSQTAFAKLATQLARSCSDLEVQNIDEKHRRQRGSICSSTSDDRLAQVQQAATRRHNRPQQTSVSSRGSNSSHCAPSSASSSLAGIGGRELQLVSQCRACSQDYRCTCCAKCSHLMIVYTPF